jgi:hypothetical protein
VPPPIVTVVELDLEPLVLSDATAWLPRTMSPPPADASVDSQKVVVDADAVAVPWLRVVSVIVNAVGA